MTQAARIRRQELKELVRALSGSEDDQILEEKTHWAEKISKKHHSATDRPAVIKRYRGLVEKYRVVGRVDLSEVLKPRIDKLENMFIDDYNVMQCAAMLLEIPGDPLKGVKPDLDSHRIEEKPRQMTWEEIVEDEPLTGDHWDITNEEELNGDSSGDESVEEYEPEPESESINEEALYDMTYDPFPQPIDTYVLSKTDSAQQTILAQQSHWNNHQEFISEGNAVRECLLALTGYPTELFGIKLIEGLFHVYPTGLDVYRMAHLSVGALSNVLHKIAENATVLAQLRQFSDQFFLDSQPKFDYKYIFGVIDRINQRISDKLLGIQDELLNSSQAVVSLLQVLSQSEEIAMEHAPLVSVLKTVTRNGNARLGLLDNLYRDLYMTEVSSSSFGSTLAQSPDDQAQSPGSETISVTSTANLHSSTRVLREVFLDILHDYPLPEWITNGEALPGLFIQPVPGVDISRYWSNKHVYQESLVPLFLKSVSQLIFDTGRAAGLLRHLSGENPATNTDWRYPDYTTTADNFISDLHTLVRNSHDATVTRLSSYLFSHCCLKQTLSMYFSVYLLQDPSGRMFEFISRMNDFSHSESSESSYPPFDRHQAAEALDESWSPVVPPCQVAEVNASTIQMIIPLATLTKGSPTEQQDQALLNFFPPATVDQYKQIWSVLYNLSRTQARLKRLRQFQELVLINQIMTEVYTTVIQTNVNKFWKYCDEGRTAQNIIDAHSQLIDTIHEQLPDLRSYDQSHSVADLAVVCNSLHIGEPTSESSHKNT